MHDPTIARLARVSQMADQLAGSEILKISGEIRAIVAEGHAVANLTVGDFNPREFRIPATFEARIERALRSGETNYPPSDGILALRQAIVHLYREWLGLEYETDSILVSGGARPVIYAAYRALVDPGDVVVYPVPSWNNNHYCHLVGARGVQVHCRADEAFLPTRDLIAPHLRDARLLALNSPLNPTGTAFDRETLSDICDLVLEENARRGPNERPLFVLYDQVYWMLTFGDTRHFDPVSLRPEMSDYTIYVDGISKPFAATGLRVGWTAGPPDVVRKMAAIVGHMGAWAPRPEQIATADFLCARDEIDAYHAVMKDEVKTRLEILFDGMEALRSEGMPVEVIPPMGAIYLSVRFAVNGMQDQHGETLETNEDIRRYLLRKAGVAVVPFQAFGSSEENGWFRISVGAVSKSECAAIFARLRTALQPLAAR